MRFEEIAIQLNLPDESVQNLLSRLITNKIIRAVEDETNTAYIPARPLEKISVLEILEIEDSSQRGPSAFPYKAEIAQTVTEVKDKTRQSLGDYSLADVLSRRLTK